MPGKRDRVRVESGERVDLGDFKALQENARMALKMGLRALIFGDPTKNPRQIDKVVQSEFDVTTSGTEVTITRGRAWAGETLDDGSTYETGVIAGEDGDASQVLDLNGQPADTYYLYVRTSFDPGVPGSRVFWDGTTPPGTETVQSIDTREVAGWKAIFSTSASPPDARYSWIGIVVWDGAAFTSNDRTFNALFEGKLTNGVEVDPAWGDNANQRNTDRAQYGIQSLMGFASAVRRQLQDIIGVSGGKWFTALPQVTRTGAQNADLQLFADHWDEQQDPHGDMTLTGTTTFTGTSTTNFETGSTLTAVNLVIAGLGSGITTTELTFSSARTGTYTIGGRGLKAYTDTGELLTGSGFGWTFLQDFDGNTRARARYDGNRTAAIWIPVVLPDGVTIDEFEVSGYSEAGGAGASATLRARLMRTSALYAVTELADVTASGAAGTPITADDNTLSQIVSSTDYYWIRVDIDNDNTVQSISLARVVVKYSSTSVAI